DQVFGRGFGSFHLLLAAGLGCALLAVASRRGSGFARLLHGLVAALLPLLPRLRIAGLGLRSILRLVLLLRLLLLLLLLPAALGVLLAFALISPGRSLLAGLTVALLVPVAIVAPATLLIALVAAVGLC